MPEEPKEKTVVNGIDRLSERSIVTQHARILPNGIRLLLFGPRAAQWTGSSYFDPIDRAKLRVADTKKRGPEGPQFTFDRGTISQGL